MRIAFSSQPIYSHLVPAVLPLAAEAAEAGHEVVVLTSPALADEVRRAGLRPLELPNAVGPAELVANPELAERYGLDFGMMSDFGRRTLAATPDFFARMFAGPPAGDFARDAIEALRDWKPDLIVGECSDYGSYYAAEVLGLASTMLDIAPLGPFDVPELLDQINAQRTELGLDEVSDPMHPFRHRRIGIISESFYPPHARSDSARYHQPPRPPAGQRLDPAIAELPGDRPMVLATLGSNAGRVHGADRSLLDTIVEVLGELPVTGVVALGRDFSPEDWQGARPDNVHLTSFVQQHLLLPACDAFITHGGFSGTREALGSGVPMVTIPMLAEQPANATRVEELGAGRRLNVEDVTHESLRETVGAVLDDPTYRYRAQHAQREFLTLPEFSEIVSELEGFAS